MLFSSCFGQKNIHKTHEIVKVAVINDNNNFAPSLFRSLCEFVGDCFGLRYFSSGAALPQKNTSVQNNHLRFHTMTSKKTVRSYYCLNNVIRMLLLAFHYYFKPTTRLVWTNPISLNNFTATSEVKEKYLNIKYNVYLPNVLVSWKQRLYTLATFYWTLSQNWERNQRTMSRFVSVRYKIRWNFIVKCVFSANSGFISCEPFLIKK